MRISTINFQPSFNGTLLANEKLKMELKHESVNELNNAYNALQRMQAKDDGLEFTYDEEEFDVSRTGCDCYEKYAVISGNNGKYHQSVQIESWDEFSGTTLMPHSASKLICDFADKYYPVKKSKPEMLAKVYDMLG